MRIRTLKELTITKEEKKKSKNMVEEGEEKGREEGEEDKGTKLFFQAISTPAFFGRQN
jgi:hypothetical protein